MSNIVFYYAAKSLEDHARRCSYNINFDFRQHNPFLPLNHDAYARLVLIGVPKEIGLSWKLKLLVRVFRGLAFIVYTLVLLFPTIMMVRIEGRIDFAGVWVWWGMFGIFVLVRYLQRGKWRKIVEARPYGWRIER